MVTIDSVRISKRGFPGIEIFEFSEPTAVVSVSQLTSIGLNAKGDVVLTGDIAKKAHDLFAEIKDHLKKEAK
jgi:hypothetical protein